MEATEPKDAAQVLQPVLTPRALATTGITVFPVAVDGSVFGWAAGIEHTLEVLDAFVGGGGQLISTADHYAGGRSEVMIGTWLARRGVRDKVLLATKIGRHPDNPGLSPRSVTNAVEASLERFGTDRIDVLSFDGDHPETPVDETLEAADALLRAGKIRFLGETGYSTARLREIHRIASTAAYPTFQVALSPYNLLERVFVEQELAPVVRELGMSLIARLPLADGYLTGNYRTRDMLPDSVMFAGAFRHIGRKGNKVLAALEQVAQEQSRSLATIALAWVLAKPGVTAAAVRARGADQLHELLAATEVQLTRQQMAALDAASA
ncbi:aldo/keto reductase [Lysobacter korlensis]|uniref:Aldo/keto reductase n=1 Tax=Lysobacter korlensis TaxID=553636 RepID=A0ABV6RYU9_9GAMM